MTSYNSTLHMPASSALLQPRNCYSHTTRLPSLSAWNCYSPATRLPARNCYSPATCLSALSCYSHATCLPALNCYSAHIGLGGRLPPPLPVPPSIVFPNHTHGLITGCMLLVPVLWPVEAWEECLNAY